MDPVLRLTYKDHHFDVGKITAQELIQVGKWTGLNNRRELRKAILSEDPSALVAVFAIARKRNGENVSYSDVDVDLDEMQVAFIDDLGREVEPVLQTNDDGSYKLDNDGDPLPVVVDGATQWRYTDTQEIVPPTSSAEASTPSPGTSPQPGDSAAFDSGIPTT